MSDFINTTLQGLGAQVLERGWLSANNIVFADGDHGATVVDTGFCTHAEQTLALLDQALAGRPLARVVNTHLHSDHCGGNAALAARWPGLHIAVPAASRSKVQPWDDARLSYRQMDQHCDPFPVHGFFDHGDTVRLGRRDWQVHSTAGHDPDAVVLFEPQTRTLISGDALWQDRLAIVFPELEGEPGFADVARTLDLIEALQPALVLPGHGQPFTDVAGALRASRQRLAGFVAAPQRHRLHAARALVVYHLLSFRQLAHTELLHWIATTPIFVSALQCANDPERARALAQETLDRLVADGVVHDDGPQADNRQVRMAAAG